MIATQKDLMELGLQLRILIVIGRPDLAMALVWQLALSVCTALGPFIRMSTQAGSG